MNESDTALGIALVLVVVAAVLGVIRLIGWLVLTKKSDEQFETVDDAFDLAHTLFGRDPWAQVIVSRTRDGYIATAHNPGRTVAVSARRFGVTPEHAVQLLCTNLRRTIDSKMKGTPLDDEGEDLVH
jgi:hypothetical protein